ncbi:MAG: hypothetical protein P9C36_05865 [Defluviicoccus sp.]|nr:hypothetical protein [Defluviicoccus sp.]MDG4592136.1 hypothetical protein [Defluviicoccus sp.]MDS4010562.1 hypothetical protein [Defluviicoccus sp.]MDS4072501.1 hypothetical protein [Defluviicoccus sp.]
MATRIPLAAGTPADLTEDAFVALVVFTGMTGIRWLKALRAGFRHCFVVVFQGDTAIVCDPLSNQMLLGSVRPATPAVVADWYCERGFTVVATEIREAPRRGARLRPLTCVEIVKRVLGIRAPFVLTPWQLYRHLLALAPKRTQETLDTRSVYEYSPRYDGPKCVQASSLVLAHGDDRDLS